MSAKSKREPRRDASKWAALTARITLNNATGLLTRTMRWYVARQKARSASRLLQVEETVSLGQKRFAAVIRVENARYLVGGGANDVVLLAALGQQPMGRDGNVDLQQSEPRSLSPAPQAAPSFRDLLERAGTSKATDTAKPAASRTKGGRKQCA